MKPSPKWFATALGAAMLSTVLVAGVPAQADPLQSKQPVASETISPTAKGAKPYSAGVSGTCEAGECSHDFGKKGNKARKIDILTCGMITPNEKGVYGLVYVDEQPMYVLPISSNEQSGTSYYTMIEFQYKFTVPMGKTLSVAVLSGGTPSSSFCTVGGTID